MSFDIDWYGQEDERLKTRLQQRRSRHRCVIVRAVMCLLGAIPVTSATAQGTTSQGDVFDQFFRYTEKENRVFFEQLPGETVDPFTGTLRLVQTDLILPGKAGLDLQVVRTYSSKIWGRTDMMDSEPLLAEKEKSVLGYGWSMHMGRLKNPYFSGDAGICSSNLPIYEAPDGTARVFYPAVSNSATYVSKDYWCLERGCTFPNSVGQTICIWSDTGVRYEFDESSAFFVGLMPVWPVRHIVDPFGNEISVAYQGQTGAISRIDDSYGREIDFNYIADDDGLRLDSLTAGSNTYSYSYIKYTSPGTPGNGKWTLPGPRRFLQTVTPPAGPSYSYEYAFDATVSQNQYALSKVVYPSGGYTSYLYESSPFYTGRESVPFAVVRQRTVAGRGLPSATWTYSYSSPTPGSRTSIEPATGTATDLSVTVIERPDGLHDTFTMYGLGYLADFNRNNMVWAAGLTLEAAKGDRAEVETVQWKAEQAISNAIYAAPSYSSGCAADAGHWLWDYGVYVPLMETRMVYRNPVADGYSAGFQTEYDNFDNYGQPQLVTETGYNGGFTTNGQSPPPQQRVTAWTYDSHPEVNILRGRPLTQVVTIGDEHFENSWTYNGPNYSRDSETRSGVTTTFGYDQYGNLRTVTNALGQTLTLSGYVEGHGTPTSIDFNGAFSISRTTSWEGWIRSQTDGRGNRTGYDYDAIGRLTKMTPPVGNATGYTYDDVNGTWAKIVRGNYHQLSQLDGLGRTISSQDSEGVQTSVRYDRMGRVWFKSYPYDSSVGEVGERLDFDAMGRVVQQIKAFRPAANTCDASGTCSGTCDTPGACTVTITYQANCVQTVVDRTNAERIAQYSPTTWRCNTSYGDPSESRLAQVQDAQGNLWNYTYTAAGMLAAVAAPLPQGNRSYSYDAHQFLVSETNSESQTIYYGRNAIGQMTSRSDARPANTTYQYTDPLSRLRHILYQNEAYDNVDQDYDRANNLAYVRSDNGGESDYVYDDVNRVTQQTWTYRAQNYVTSYDYDTAGCLRHLTYPSGLVLAMTCDTANRVKTVTATENGHETTLVSDVSYHASGQVQTVTLGNGHTTSVVYDDRARARSVTTPGVLGLTYGYDGADNVVYFGNTEAPGSVREMTYDQLDRLWLSYSPHRWGNALYEYDELGNRKSKKTDSFTTNYTIEAQTNRLASISGNRTLIPTMTLTWDVAGRLASSSDGVVYRYDGRGRRVEKSGPGGTTLYHYDTAGRVLAETLPDGTKLRDYIYLGNKLIAISGCVEGTNSSTCSGTQWYHTDTLGSVLARTDTTGAVVAQFDYQPWGEQWTVPAVQGDRQYNGRVYDPGTGFHDYGARLYWPEIGRFVSVDSAGPDPANPMSFNRYSYTFNNPYKYTDPDGRNPLIVAGLACAAAGFVGSMVGSYLDNGEVNWNAATQWAAKGFLIGMTAGLGTKLLAESEAASATLTTVATAGTGTVALAKQAEPALSQAGQALMRAEPTGSALKGDIYHRSATFMREIAARTGTHLEITGGDGAKRTLTQVPGKLNDAAGRYEYIVDEAGKLVHQMFVEGGTISGAPIKP